MTHTHTRPHDSHDATTDLDQRRDTEAELWQQADSFDAVCELTARWIEGNLIYNPGYLADEVDDETLPIRDTIANLNRAGLLTYGSEPADTGPDLYLSTGLPWRCRSNLFGWIREPRLLYLLDDICRSQGLWMVTAPAEHATITGHYWTLEANGQPIHIAHTNEFDAPTRDEIFFPHHRAVEQVLDAVWLRIIDPDFDSGMRMWRALDTVTRIRSKAKWNNHTHPRRRPPKAHKKTRPLWMAIKGGFFEPQVDAAQNIR